MAVAIAEEADFERLDQLLDVLHAGQQRRHHDQRPGARGDASVEIDLRQRPRDSQPGHHRVHQGDRHLAGAQQPENAEHSEEPARRAAGSQGGRQRDRGRQCEHRDRPEVGRQRVPEAEAPDVLDDREPNAAPRVRATRVPHRRGSTRRAPPGRPAPRSPRPFPRARWRARATSASVRGLCLAVILDDVAVAVAGGEVHRRRRRRRDRRAASARRRSCASTKSRQSVAPRNRRLLMLLPIETWSAACCWFSVWTSCSMVRPSSDKPLLEPASAAAPAPGLGPGRWRVNSATNDPDHGRLGPRHVRHHRIRLVGSFSATPSSGRPSRRRGRGRRGRRRSARPPGADSRSGPAAA